MVDASGVVPQAGQWFWGGREEVAAPVGVGLGVARLLSPRANQGRLAFRDSEDDLSVDGLSGVTDLIGEEAGLDPGFSRRSMARPGTAGHRSDSAGVRGQS